MRAAKGSDVPVMRLLLDAGADPTLTQTSYTNAVMLAAAGGRAGTFGTAAFRITEQGSIEAIKLCLDRGADINAFNASGQTAMHSAAARGADGIVRFLAEQGAKLDMKNKQGRTPLDLALGAGDGRRGKGAGGGHESTAALLRQLANGTTGPTK
jgi:ankyrin repeat protein